MTHIEYLEKKLQEYKEIAENVEGHEYIFWNGAVMALEIVIKDLKEGVED